MMKKAKIRVLVVDDSALIRKVLCAMIEPDDRFEVVGCTDTGSNAVEMCMQYHPDVISMDINMPDMDGIEATRQIMCQLPTPIVIVSGFYNSSEVAMAINALEAGAVFIMEKPFAIGHPNYESSKRNYLSTLKIMSEVKVVRRKSIPKNSDKIKVENENDTCLSTNTDFQVVVIGASAGGPESVRKLLENLSADFPLPVIFVQHIDPHFAEGFAEWLNTYSKLKVIIAKNKMPLKSGTVFMPPGKSHIIINADKTIGLIPEVNQNELVPSVNKLFASAADVFGKHTIAVLLTGMGKDGALMMKKLHSAGALTFAQDEKSCLVFGMPHEAILLNAVSKVLSPSEIAFEISSKIKIKN